MKRWLKWGILALVLLLVAAAAWRSLAARKAQQAAVAAAAASKAEAQIELAQTDVVRAQSRELAQGLPISGALKAANSAVVKARVAGELQGLSVREGDAVKAGQVVARVDPSEYQSRLKQAQEQGAAAKAQIDIAQRLYDNNKALVEQGFISRTALEGSQATLQSAQSTWLAARAAIDVAQKSLDDTVLYAPISGLVSQRLAQPGERVAVDGRIVEIVDLSQIELEATLAGADAIGVRVGQQATLAVEGAAQTAAAQVVRINPSAQAGSRSVLVYLRVAATEGLRNGMFAQGTLDTARVRLLAVPLSAVRTDKPEPYVQVVENNTVTHKPVKTGAQGRTQGEWMVAVTGLSEGASVIVGAVGPVREGTRVKFTAVQGPAAPSPVAGNSAARNAS